MNVNDSVTKVTSIHLSYYLLNNILSDKTMSLILPGTKALSFLEVFSIFSVKIRIFQGMLLLKDFFLINLM